MYDPMTGKPLPREEVESIRREQEVRYVMKDGILREYAVRRRNFTPLLLTKLGRHLGDLKDQRSEAPTAEQQAAVDTRIQAAIAARNALSVIQSRLGALRGEPSKVKGKTRQTTYRIQNAKGDTVTRRTQAYLVKHHEARIASATDPNVRRARKREYSQALMQLAADHARLRAQQVEAMRVAYETLGTRPPDNIAQTIALERTVTEPAPERQVAVASRPSEALPEPPPPPSSGSWAIEPARIFLGNFHPARASEISPPNIAFLVNKAGEIARIDLDVALADPQIRDAIRDGTPLDVKQLRVSGEYREEGKHAELLDRLTDWTAVLAGYVVEGE
jgi:hypothetical protein